MPVQTKAEVFSLLQIYQQELHQFGVNRCGVFGSFVRDIAMGDRSDVDILVDFDPSQKILKATYLDIKAKIIDSETKEERTVIIEMQVLNIEGFEKSILHCQSNFYQPTDFTAVI